MPYKDLCSLFSEKLNVFVLFYVRTGDLIANIKEYLGYTAHAYTAYTYKVEASDPFSEHWVYCITLVVSVAQLDRAWVSGTQGRGFPSPRTRLYPHAGQPIAAVGTGAFFKMVLSPVAYSL